MSYQKLTHKPLNASLNTLLKRVAHVGLGVGAFTPILVMANPTGSQVVAGQATIAAQNANKLVISQASNSAIINWQQFSIGQGQYVQFLQPSSSSVVLNRVVGGNASSILGTLNANGQVFLVNPNGIFFGKSASLDVQGIVASTLDIADSDFLSGNYVFDKGTGSDASVTNQGNIQARQGGYVVLAGDYAENDGIIQAKSGHIILASGTRTTLTLNGNNLVNFAVNDATLASFAGTKNTGSLIADGGTVIMTADVANALKATVVNNTGLIEAHAIGKTGGAIYLIAEGGNLTNAGTLDADATAQGRAGGDIVLKADGLTDLTSTSKITATGLDADGGNLEISGNTLRVRGTATLGKGGNLLLDPNSVDIVAGLASSGKSAGVGTGANANIGLTFIENALHGGTNVAISAANNIFHSANVKAITATGAGNLSFKVGTSGHLEFKGMDIAIGGALTASFGYGSFGFITAKSVALNGSHGGPSSMTLHNATTSAHGAVTKYSVLATGGDVDINGKQISGFTSASTGLLAIKATGGDVNLTAGLRASGEFNGSVTLVGKSITDTKGIFVNGNVTLTASAGSLTAGQVGAEKGVTATATGGNMVLGNVAAYGGNLTLTDTTGNMSVGIVSDEGNAVLNAGANNLTFTHNSGGNAVAGATGNLTITASTITDPNGGTFFLNAEGNLTVTGQITTAASHTQNLRLEAGEAGTITLSKGLKAAQGSLDLVGDKLVYTGGKSFDVSAASGNLYMDVNIGSASKLAAYNVNLTENGYGMYVQKSIFTGNTAGKTAANITATQTGLAGGGILHGVLVGNSSGASVTLQAAGSVTLTGENVGLAHARGQSSSRSSYGSVKVIAGKNVTFTATGAASLHNGNVGIQAGNAEAKNAKDNTSILVQAGGNISVTGAKVNIQAGSAIAQVSPGHASASDNANVTLIAGGSVDLVGGNSANGHVQVSAGYAYAGGSESVASKTNKAIANANVSITAGTGKNITISATRVNASAGYGVAQALDKQKADVTTATATADLTFKAGGNVVLTGASAASGSAVVKSGGYTGENGYGAAEGSDAKATATAHADVSVTAGGAIDISAHRATVSVGYGAGWQSSGGHIRNVATAFDIGATATYTATNNLTFTAGAGGISIEGLGSQVYVDAGAGILNGAGASADETKAVATATASGLLTFTTKGTLSVVSNEILGVNAGYAVAARAQAEGNEGGAATLSGNGGVVFTAANITLGSTEGSNGRVRITGGQSAARSDTVGAGSHGVATVAGSARVDLTATTGNITVDGGHYVIFEAGSEAASSPDGSIGTGPKGHATLSGNAGVSMTAGGNITLAAALTGGSSRFVHIAGGSTAAAGVTLKALNGGMASVTGLASADITAGKVFTVKGFDIGLNAGSNVAGENDIQAGSTHAAGTATLTGNAALNIKAGSIVLQGGESVLLDAGRVGYSDHVSGIKGGIATVTGIADVNVIATGAIQITASAGGSRASGIGLFGGQSVGAAASAGTASHGKATLNASGKLNVQGKSVSISAANAAVRIGAESIPTFSGSGTISRGNNVGHLTQAHADGGGQASVGATGGVSIKATGGDITVTGKTLVSVRGGSNVAAGSLHTNSGSVNLGTSHGSQLIGHSFNQIVNPVTATANGAGAKAAISANAGVTLSATGNVTLHQTANSNGAVSVAGGYAAAYLVHASASYGAAATISGVANVSITAGGALTLEGRRVAVFGGSRAGAMSPSGSRHYIQHAPMSASSYRTNYSSSAGVNADVAHGKASKISITADGSVALTGGTVGITATGSNATIGAGSTAGRMVELHASNGAQATETANAGIGIKATKGALSITAKSRLEVYGGYGAAAGRTTSTSSHRILSSSSGGARTGSGNYLQKVFFAAASANGAGAKAALSATAGVTLSATGAVTLLEQTGGGQLDISAGNDAAGMVHAAASAGATATVSGVSAISIVAGGALTIQGRRVDMRGGYAAAATAPSVSSHYVRQRSSGGSSHLTSLASSFRVTPDVAKGKGSKVSVTGDASLSLAGTTVTLSASASSLTIGAGDAAGRLDQVHASSGGQAAVTANAGIGIKATKGALTVISHRELTVAGGESAAGGIENGTSTIKFLGSSTGGVTSFSVNRFERVFTANAIANGAGAKASLTATAGVNLSATGTVTLQQASPGLLEVSGGYGAGVHASANANAGGVASLTATANLVITGSALTLKGGNVSVHAGGGALGGTGSTIRHYIQHKGGSSGTNSSGTVNRVTPRISAAKGVGSKVSVSGDGSVTLTGGVVSISASTGNLAIYDDGSDAKAIHAEANNGGSAALLANDLVSIKATSGALTLTAAHGTLQISGGGGHGDSARASAAGAGAKAAFTVNDSILLQAAKAVTMTAGTNLSVTTASGADDAGASASFKGVATFTQTESVDIKAGGAFLAKASGSLVLNTDLGGGSEAARAHLTGAQATFTQDGSLNISATTVSLSASHNIDVVAGEFNGWHAAASAAGPATATLSVNRALSITAVNAINMTLLGAGTNGSIVVLGGSAGKAAVTQAVDGGKATLTEVSDLNLKVTGATGTINLNAGAHTRGGVAVGDGRVGAPLSSSSGSLTLGVEASHGGIAAATATASLNMTAAGAISMTAGADGNIYVRGQSDGRGAFVLASGSKAKATATLTAVTNISGGSVTLTAGRNIFIGAGSDLAEFAGVHGAEGGIAALTVTGGLKITTPGTFTAAAGGYLTIANVGGSSSGRVAYGADVTASFGAAQATLTANDAIQITAGTVVLTATHNDLGIDGGSSAANSARVQAAAKGDKATLSVTDSVTITAAHNFTITAGDNVDIRGGGGSFFSSMFVQAGSGATAKATVDSSVNLTAGAALTVTASQGIDVIGGGDVLANVDAFTGGLGSVALNESVNLKAGTNATLTATGGSMFIAGGGVAGIAADLFPSVSSHEPLPPGTVKGTLNTSVNITAGGNVALSAGGALVVAAGDGETLTVGARRMLEPSSAGTALEGHTWGGGSANLTANLSAVITAGKNLTVTAGTAFTGTGTNSTGGLYIQGLGKNPLQGNGFQNVVSVRGGSDHAVAKLTLTANALLNAGGSITLNAAGNASIAGGEIDTVRADHTIGTVTVLGSADAGLHAGGDVVLNDIQGSLTLAGANTGPSAGQMLVDAHGSEGVATAIGHADAFISAGKDIVTVTAMTGGLNLLGGQLVAAVTLGSAAKQQATLTANASLHAGGNITITGDGDLNVLGGSFDEASVTGSNGTGTRIATLQAHAAITAGAAVKLTLQGNAFIAGGDSVAATVQYSGAGLQTGTATVDAGASIKGANVTLAIGGGTLGASMSGNFKARGGSGAQATAVTVGQSVTALASDNVGVTIAATKGNLTITTTGDETSFLGGSGAAGKAENLFSNNTATTKTNANMNLSATGNISLTVAGNLLVAGGADAQQFGTVIGGAPAGRLSSSAIRADNSKTTVTVTSGVQFTAGGAIAVKQTGAAADLSILGGSNAASFNSANAVGSHAVTKVTVDSNVLIKAAGALTFTGASNVLLSAGKLVTSGSAAPFLFHSGVGATVTVAIDSSVKLVGKTVSVGHVNTPVINSSATISSGGLTQVGIVTPHPSVVHTHSTGLSVRALSLQLTALETNALHIAPLTSHTSFGGVQTLSGVPVTDIQDTVVQPVSVESTPATISVQAETPAPLSTLQDASLVMSLVSLVAPEVEASLAQPTLTDDATLFTPVTTGNSYSSSFSGGCVALVVQGGRTRCASGSK